MLGGIALERRDTSECLQRCYTQFCHPGGHRKSPKPPPTGPRGQTRQVLWKPAGGRDSPSPAAHRACHGDHQATTTQGDLHGDGTSPERECWDRTSPSSSPSSLITRPIRPPPTSFSPSLPPHHNGPRTATNTAASTAANPTTNGAPTSPPAPSLPSFPSFPTIYTANTHSPHPFYLYHTPQLPDTGYRQRASALEFNGLGFNPSSESKSLSCCETQWLQL